LLVEPAIGEGGRRPTVRPADGARIAQAVTAALCDPGYSLAAAGIAREMASLPSVEEVLAALGE
jgi:hypothetical protein